MALDVAQPAPSASSARRVKAVRLAWLGWVLLAGVHYFILSAGGVWPLPNYSAYYNRLADGFARGQTSVILKPVPGLLALPDPYDPVANRPFRRGVGVHDTLLYDGKLYLYWGPAPAMMIAGLKAVHIIPPMIVGDEWLVLGFVLLADAMVAMLLYRLWSKCFQNRSPSILFVGLMVYGLASPMTYFLARPAVYEAAIAGGQCFLLAGIGFAWVGVEAAKKMSPVPEPANGRQEPAVQVQKLGRSLFFLFAAGVSLALAVGCRVSLAIAVAAIGFAVCVSLVWSTSSFIRGLRPSKTTESAIPQPMASDRSLGVPWASLAAIGFPLVCGALLLAIYNHARFGQYLEFGQRFQLGGANYHSASLFGTANVWPSLWSYVVRPPTAGPAFPFLRAQAGKDTFPDWVTLPSSYESQEPIAGLLWVVPIAVLALVPLLGLLRRRKRLASSGRMVILLLAMGGLLGFAPCLFLIGSTERYLMDFWPTVAALTTIGLWQMPQSSRALVWLLRVGAGALMFLTIATGLLLGFSGYFEHFRTWNPWLYQSLGGKLPTWEESPAEPQRLMEGSISAPPARR